MAAKPVEKRKRKGGCPSFVKTADGKRYTIGETLGKGGFGIVKLATEDLSRAQYAAKIMDMEIVRRDNLLKYIERETRMVKQLSHPHIVKLLDVVDVEDYDLRIYIMELASNGELFDQIVAVSRFSEKTARRYYQQFISGVRYCHSQGVVHRDLKAENLLLSKDNTLKICDFGLSRYCAEEGFTDHQTMFTSIAGSLDYQAPEILRDRAYHGKPADIWACGVILAFMVSGWLPFQDAHSDDMTRRRILSSPPNFKLHDDISKEVRDLVGKCLVVEPKRRITADLIIGHPWFQDGLGPKRCRALKIPERLLGGHDGSERGNTGRAGSTYASPITAPGGQHASAFVNVDKGLLTQLRLAFDTIDVDKSGYIKEEELRDVLIQLGGADLRAGAHGKAWEPSHEEVTGLLKFFDTAGDGQISFSEFVVGFVEKNVEKAHSLGERLRLSDLIEKLSHHGILSYDPRDKAMREYIETFREAFNEIDEDKSGVIRERELHNLVRRAGVDCSDEEIESLFESLDTHHQHFITFEEFVSGWLKSQNLQPEDGALELLSRLRKCKELMAVSEQDEARKTLSLASTLGVALAGDVKSVAACLRGALGGRVVVQDEQEGQDSVSLKVLWSTGRCEVSFEVAPLLTGYSRVSCRRLEGKTAQFHAFYKMCCAELQKTGAYQQAERDLEEEGEEEYV